MAKRTYGYLLHYSNGTRFLYHTTQPVTAPTTKIVPPAITGAPEHGGKNIVKFFCNNPHSVI